MNTKKKQLVMRHIKLQSLFFVVLAIAFSSSVFAQTDTVVYRLTIDQKTVNNTGKYVNDVTYSQDSVTFLIYLNVS